MQKNLYTPEEAKARYESLPPEIKSLLYSPEMHTVIQNTAQKHQLHIDQVGILEDETSAAMLGFTEAKDFPEILQDSLAVDRTKADAISQDINELLFLKIRESMKQAPGHQSSAPSPTTSAAAPTSIPIPIPVIPSTPKPAELHPADMMLSQTTTTAVPAPQMTPAPAPVAAAAPASASPDTAKSATPAKEEPPAPKPYNADPYREPIG